MSTESPVSGGRERTKSVQAEMLANFLTLPPVLTQNVVRRAQKYVCAPAKIPVM